MLKPSRDFYRPFQGGASFVDPYCYLCFTLSLLYCLVRSLQPCDYLLGNGSPLGFLDVFLCFCHFPNGVLGQVWYLIVSIPDLCLLLYFYSYGFPLIARRLVMDQTKTTLI